jgi:hypothetical protein
MGLIGIKRRRILHRFQKYKFTLVTKCNKKSYQQKKRAVKQPFYLCRGNILKKSQIHHEKQYGKF